MLKLDMGKESSYTTKIGWKILLTQIKQLVILYIWYLNGMLYFCLQTCKNIATKKYCYNSVGHLQKHMT